MAVAISKLTTIRHPLVRICQPNSWGKSRTKAYITAHGVGNIGKFTANATTAQKRNMAKRLTTIGFLLSKIFHFMKKYPSPPF